MRIINGSDDLAEGAAHLAAVCPVWARVLPGLGPLPLYRRADGFGAVLDAIVGQQISLDAAGAIMRRLAAMGLTEEAAFAQASDDDLRLAGLTRPRQRYLRAIAAAGVDWAGLRTLPDAEVYLRLIALPGIGPWTAQIYLKGALGRADVLAAGDLALQEGARLVYDLPARPDPAALTALAAPWRPWRSVAGRALWAYYLRAKGRKAMT